ncbi:MAG: entericidin [Rickettsiales bacterium]
MLSRHKLLSLVLVVSALVGTAACNTMQGLGHDVKKAGGSLEGSAERNKNY